MASIQNDLRLFGLDLRHLGQDLRRAWQGLEQSPLLSWLTPEPTVRLLHSDGQASLWQMGATPSVRRGAAAGPAPRFTAVELPQELFLQREISLPALADDQVRAAVALEVQSASPFAAADLAWGYRSAEAGNGQLRVVAVMASRPQVAAHLQSLPSLKTPHPPLGAGAAPESPQVPEVWAFADAVRQPVVLAGYGEPRRLRHIAIRRNAGHGLLALALVLLAAIALTPTAQLRMRAVEAMRLHAELVERAAPLVDKREALMQSVEQLKGLSHELAGRIDPLRVVETLTQVLPDDTSVQNLKLQGAKVTISGVTANASSLMQLLGAQPGLRDVRAPSAATRAPGAQRESFVVEFVLDPASFNVVTTTPEPSPAEPAASAPAATASQPASAAAPPVPPAAAPNPPPANPAATFGGGATFGGAPTKPPATKPAAGSPGASGSGAKP
jgi:general secretion pathway protein L